MAMENTLSISHFPIETSICKQFSVCHVWLPEGIPWLAQSIPPHRISWDPLVPFLSTHAAPCGESCFPTSSCGPCDRAPLLSGLTLGFRDFHHEKCGFWTIKHVALRCVKNGEPSWSQHLLKPGKANHKPSTLGVQSAACLVSVTQRSHLRFR